MTTYLVSRHIGTVDWFVQQGIEIDKHIQHLDTKVVQEGDCVVGTLPIQLAAKVCEQGARYLHLEVTVPFEWRGKELNARQLNEFGATLKSFFVQQVP